MKQLFLGMEIAVVLNAHHDPSLTRDTLDSILTHVSGKVLLVVDGLYWDRFKRVSLPASKLEGFRHGVPRSPYRNVALGLKMASEQWPGAWVVYTEYDVLFASSRFRKNLELADKAKVWMLGNDGHAGSVAMPLINSLLGEPLRNCYYLLGCCLFFHPDFLAKLKEIDFFDRFLNLTNGFSEGYFPFYSGYDLSENLYPSLCRHFGGNIGVFASWDGEKKEWHGSYQHYPLRWRPELDPVNEDFPEASVLHPLKTFDHPIRKRHRERRKCGV